MNAKDNIAHLEAINGFDCLNINSHKSIPETMNKPQIIQAIDARLKEYEKFPSTWNRLVKIRGKLLHNVRLSENDMITLKNEGYAI